MPIIEINDVNEKGVEVFSSLTEHQLRNARYGDEDSEEGIIIVESPKVIRVALEEGYEPVSLLCEKKHISGDATDIIGLHPEMTVYTGEREVLARLTGYTLTRGVLCAMKRRQSPLAAEICREATTMAVIEGVCDTTNIGSIFRSAAALGIGGILLTADSCDPFNRRSIRVSMGTVFKIPWTFCDEPINLLREHGFVTVALALEKDSIPLDSPFLKQCEKIALVLGTEGEGLSKKMITSCDYKAIIPMFRNVDSLNVGSAAAIAFWEINH